MDTQLPTSTVSCTQCGGELHPDEGQIFLTCPFCGSAVYLDKARVVFHWYVAPTLDQAQAQAALRRWMSGSQTVKDLDQKARLVESSFEYFPIWYFRRAGHNGQEQIQIVPAAATAISELRRLNLPAGDLRKYTPEIEAQSHAPSVPLAAAQNWLGQASEKRGPKDPARLPEARGELAEQSLVHVPLYTFKYAYNGQTYLALVEGASGGVFANLYPAKAEAPYLAIGGLTALVFLCLALFPVVGGLAEGGDGAGIGFALCSALGLVAAPILFGIAVWVAAKI
ncbi:MAG: hypothetical protein ACKOC5_02630 [Chloroflexota bacterium]